MSKSISGDAPASASLQLNELKKYFAANSQRFISELSEFLAIPSVSTDPTLKSECGRCAAWLLSQLQGLGFAGELRFAETGYPIVLAHNSVGLLNTGPISSGARRVSIYGHYDVQPCDPLELWNAPPFSPVLKDGRLYARGAQDNKGQLWYVIKALEFLQTSGALANMNIALCVEGQEENGSAVLAQNLAALKTELKADTLMVCDTGTLSKNVATITMGLRGIAHFTVTVRGPNKDLHSGVHGGVARNPAQELVRLLAALHDESGRVAVAGFYNGVTEPTADETSLAVAGAPTEGEYQQLVGACASGGERDYALAVRGGLRPTLEFNGVHSGYGGTGSKTIIPALAFAKISMRLVAGQDGAQVLKMVCDHLIERAIGVTLEITEKLVGGPAIIVSPQSESVRRIVPALTEMMGCAPIFRWEGASIPIVSELTKVSGAEPLMVGFGLEEDNIHAPNESFAIEQFERGFIYVVQALLALTKVVQRD